MATYEYTAFNKDGKETKGILEADTERQARDQLRESNLTIISICSVSKKDNKKKRTSKLFTPSQLRIKKSEIVLFTRQLSILLSSGLSLEESLYSLAEETEKKNMKTVVFALRDHVRQGEMFSTALDNFPKIFNPMYRATIHAGENSGHLDQVLNDLSDYIEKKEITRMKLQQATIYPVIMLTVCIGIVSFLLTYVVPQLVQVFSQQNVKLPEITIIVINLSHFLKNYGLYAAIGLIVFIIWFKWKLNNKNFKNRIDSIKLKLPIFGKAIRILNTARFARTFGILFSAGLPILESMRAASNVVTNLPIHSRLNEAEVAVKEGESISKALKNTNYFPPISIHLIANGEKSGQLKQMLFKSASIQDMEVERMINVLMSLFEPFITIFMGFIIGIIVIAVLLPIFNMSQLIR